MELRGSEQQGGEEGVGGFRAWGKEQDVGLEFSFIRGEQRGIYSGRVWGLVSPSPGGVAGR